MRLQFLIGPILGVFSPVATRPTQFRSTRTPSNPDAIRVILRLPSRAGHSPEFLIDNFRKTRAIRNHIQLKQTKQHHQILIDNFVDPPPSPVDTRDNWKSSHPSNLGKDGPPSFAMILLRRGEALR